MKAVKNYSFSFLILFFFLLLPKIVISNFDSIKDSQGILIGELLVIIYSSIGIICQSKTFFNSKWFNSSYLSLIIFITYYVLFSSLISSLYHNISATNSIIYFIRITIYFLLPYLISRSFNYFDNKSFYSFFKSIYLIHAILALCVYFFYSFKHNPILNERLWNDLPGYRLMPIFGLGLNFFSSDLLVTVGGGSGNLLGAMSLAFLILVDSFEINRRTKIFLFSLTFLITILSLSRGSFLSITIFTIYTQFLRDKSILYKISISVFFLIILYFCFSLIDTSAEYPALFQRLVNTFQDGEVDGSSADRLVNYKHVFNVFLKSPFYLLFGIGFDEKIFETVTNWTLVESFLLSIPIYSGIIGVILFFWFVYTVYRKSKFNQMAKKLFSFILYSSIVNWTITGSDFLTAPTLFFMINALFFSNRTLNSNSNNESSVSS